MGVENYLHQLTGSLGGPYVGVTPLYFFRGDIYSHWQGTSRRWLVCKRKTSKMGLWWGFQN